ncbi:unnamed protein product [Aureobasidium vineae]|uniref:Uncharacterized protein n=1 Tax=Aureobasidium vineae TaxID=2773715 RepID=A0A9N8JHU9_9PEZI|nr:unnamed protein product [Aureobasidium vineae]
MPPKQTQKTANSKASNKSTKTMSNNNSNQAPQGISEHEIKQNSGVSATMALQATQKHGN